MTFAPPVLGPTLQTERLILRPPVEADFERWSDFMSDPATMEFIGGAQPPNLAWRAMMTMAGAWALTGVGMFSVIEKASGRWIGRVGPWRPHGWPAPEVGWSLHRDAMGKGYAFEAAVAAIDYAFEGLGWDEVTHIIVPANTPSQRLATRLGSVNRGRCALPAPFSDLEADLWGQTRDDWRRKRPG